MVQPYEGEGLRKAVITAPCGQGIQHIVTGWPQQMGLNARPLHSDGDLDN